MWRILDNDTASFGTKLDDDSVAMWYEEDKMYGIYTKKEENVWVLKFTALSLKAIGG